MKRSISLLLTLLLILSLTACAAPAVEPAAASAPQPTSTPALEKAAEPVKSDMPPAGEYERALWYGFVPEELASADPESPVTWAQYCKMLGLMIAAYDESLLPGWESMTAAAPDTEMKRDGAAIALLFAARTMGMDWYNKSPFDLYDDAYSWGEHYSWDYPVFDWETAFPLQEAFIADICDSANAIAPSYWFLLGRVSCITIEPMLEINAGDPNFEALLTCRAALVSVVRLYESTKEVALKLAEAQLEYGKQTSAGAEIIAKAEARKQEIQSSETAIVKSDTYIQGESYTGTAYYVSNSGSDSADGLTPGTAFATLERLESIDLKHGDAIFFERGGLWRAAQMPQSILQTQGITLSAYGTGEKPRFYGSPESGVGEEKWELYYEGENGKKIWKFYQEMTDCSAVVLNGAESIKRDVPYWDGTDFVCMDDFSVPYAVETHLNDKELFVELPYEESPKGEQSELDRLGTCIAIGSDGKNLTGPLYLRYDAGNPGGMYDEIEFIAAYQAFGSMSDYTTLDNLCIRYSTRSICGGYWDGVSNDHLTIQNCETGWMGGGVNFYGDRQNATGFGYVHMDGGGFNLNGSYETISNNYSHHTFQESSAYETFDGDPDPATDIVIRDNVMEYVLMGLTVLNWETDAESPHMLGDVLVENNIVLYSGFETLYNTEYPRKGPEHGETHWPARLGIEVMDTAALSTRLGGENYHINGNTFAFSAFSLLRLEQMDIPQPPTFDGNTFAPLPGFPIKHTFVNLWGPVIANMDAQAVIQDELGDSNAAIILID